MLAFLVGCGGETGPAGAAGPQGPEGPPGAPGQDGTSDPSVSAVSPNRAFLERSMMVSISGYGTRWDDAPTVDFGGAGVTVDDVLVASPTALLAFITVDANAELSVRDVTVTSGDSSITYDNAFAVEPPINNVRYGGTVAQGSLFFAYGEVMDRDTPLDPQAGVTLQIGDNGSRYLLSPEEISAYSFSSLAFIDVMADTTASDLIVLSGFDMAQTSSRFPDAFTPTARTAMPIALGTGATATIATELETHLFSFTRTTDGPMLVTVTPDNPDAGGGALLLPESGRWEDVAPEHELLIYTQVRLPPAATAETNYLVYIDPSAMTGYGITVTAEAYPDEPNTCMTAQMVATPADIQGIGLWGAEDEDWFAIDVPATAVGGTIEVATTPGDDATDTVVDVLMDDCTTSLGGPSADADYHETFVSAPIPAAGTYYVRVTNSTFGYAGEFYNLSIVVNEPAPPDPNEPNETCMMATPTMLPANVTGLSLADEMDVDWYAVDVTAAGVGQRLHAATLAGDTDTDTVVEFFASDCTTSLGGPSSDLVYLDSRTSPIITTPGTYFVKVSHSTYPFAGSAYNLVISLIADEVEPNDTSGTASPLSAPAAAGAISFAGDQDWYAIPLTAGATLEVLLHDGESDVCGSAGIIDSEVEIYDTDGMTSLAFNDDAGAGYYCSIASITASAAGTYYVRVASSAQYAPDGLFNYTLSPTITP